MSDAPLHKPAIPTTPLSNGFWSALGRGQLLITRCDSCGHEFHYPRARCPACWSTALGSVVASGRGSVWSRTVVHVPGHAAWRDEAPYCVALVRLVEGPVLLTNIVGVEPAAVVVGAPVEAVYQESGNGTLLTFRPLHREDRSGGAMAHRRPSPP